MENLKGKFDLSADEATLDLDKLVEVAQIATSLAREDLNQLIHKQYDLIYLPSMVDAEEIVRMSGFLAKAMIAWEYCDGARERKLVKVDNLLR